MRIGIIGKGAVGASLGQRLASVGYCVRFGERISGEASGLIAGMSGDVGALPLRSLAAEVEVLLLAVPASAAVEALHAAGPLAGKVVIDCINPVGHDDGGLFVSQLPEGSMSAHLSSSFPSARIVKAFNTFGAESMGPGALRGARVDVHLATDDEDARAQVAAICETAGFSVVHCGSLRNAALLEHMGVLWIQLAVFGGNGRDVAFKLSATR